MKTKLLAIIVAYLCMATQCDDKEEILPENIKLYGYVFDKDTQLNLSDAFVEVKGVQGMMAPFDVTKTITDSMGFFDVNFKPQNNNYSIRFEKAGYNN